MAAIVDTDDLHSLLIDLKKSFGDDSICILGENTKLSNVETRTSGSLMLDIALGGGYGKGRAVEARGAEKCGKSTILFMAIAAAQKLEPDKYCAIIDLENAFSVEWATLIGVNTRKLVFSQPDKSAEGVYEMIEKMLKTGKFSIIGLDSLSGLVPKDEYENDDWDKNSRVGGTSGVNTKAIRKLINTGLLTKSGTTLFLINQLRDNIGVMYGPTTTTSGGRSIKHAMTHQLDVTTGEYFSTGSKDDKHFVGQQICVKVAKNKIGPPLRRAVINIYYENGVDAVAELVIVAKHYGVFAGAGAWLTAIDPRTGETLAYEDKEIKFNGKDKAREAIVADIEATGGGLYKLLYGLVDEISKLPKGV